MMNFSLKKYVSTVKSELIILGIFLILGLVSCTLNREEYAGIINGVKISKKDFINSYRGHFTSFRLQNDRIPDDKDKIQIGKQTWRDITIHIILKKYYKDYQIQVTEQEVIDTLLNNIPPYILNAPVFNSQGTFNKTAYTQSILNNVPPDMSWLKRLYYTYYVPTAKLKKELMNSSLIKADDIKKLYNIMNSAADIFWIEFDPSAQEVKVSQSEIESFYNTHLSDYEIQPSIEYGYVVIPVELTENDIDYAKAKIDSVYTSLKSGIPFESLARQCSQSQTASNGGSLGFVQIESLPSKLKESLAKLNKGEFTSPIKSKDNWVIYQLVEKTANYAKLNEIVIKICPSSQTLEKTLQKSIDLRELGLQIGLEKAAKELNYNYQITGKLGKNDNWYVDAEICAYLSDGAFSRKHPGIMEPVYSKATQSYILADVLTIQPFQYKPLFEVNDEIKHNLERKKQISYAETTASSWISQYKTDPISNAKKQNLPFFTTNALKITDKVKQEDIKTVFIDILQNYQNGKPPKPIELNQMILIPIVTKVVSINPPLIPEQNCRRFYFEEVNPKWFEQWLEEEIVNAKKVIWFNNP